MDVNYLVLKLPSRHFHLNGIPCLVPHERPANRGFVGYLELDGVGFGRTHDVVLNLFL